MWRSRYTAEHKLHFHAYVQGESGGILLAKMAKHSGKSRTELQQLIASVRPLEFYVPDPDHRAEWTGDEDVVVGSQLEEEDVPVFYTTGGAPLFVGANDFPEQPTLSLVPVESDFSVQLDPNTFENGQDRNGETIGTYQVARGLIANQSGIGDVRRHRQMRFTSGELASKSILATFAPSTIMSQNSVVRLNSSC